MKLMVLDGNSLVNRAFFGIKLLTTKEEGRPCRDCSGRGGRANLPFISHLR